MLWRKKIGTGIVGLDKMLHGGLLAGRPYIVSGAPGSGKTILSMAFLLEGARRGERVLFVALGEPPNEIKENIESFGCKLDGIEILDANSDIRRFEPTPILEISSETEPLDMKHLPRGIRKSPEFESHVVTIHSLQQCLKRLFVRKRYSRIVVDSMTDLRLFCMKDFEESVSIQSFMRFLSESKVTSLLTLEMPEVSLSAPETFLARGEIRLHRMRNGTGIRRFVSIEKYKGSSHDEAIFPMEITEKGIVVHHS